jgi:pilus assembly protein TadC
MTLSVALVAVAVLLCLRAAPDDCRMPRLLGGTPNRARARARGSATPPWTAAAAAPFALELIAACIEAGEPPAQALSLVADCIGEPLAGPLARVSLALELGSSAEQAWAIVEVEELPVLRLTADRFIHAEHSGAALAPALMSLATSERARLTAARQVAARRVGVLAVAPLGLCFLPAFVLAGVVPVVAGLFHQLSL